MNDLVLAPSWSHYLEIPVRTAAPVKLESILRTRMEAFRKSRELSIDNCREEK